MRLWMLTKQWQMGEFRGSDAGSPVFAKLLLATTRLTKYRAGEWRRATVRLVDRHSRPRSSAARCRMQRQTAHHRARSAPGDGAPVVRADRRHVADYRDAFKTAVPDREARSHAERRTSMSARIRRSGTRFRRWPVAPWMAAHCWNICWPILRITPTTASPESPPATMPRPRRSRATLPGMGRTVS